jgi:hypothetical protein
VEFGLCFDSPDEGKPEYDCMRVRFNLEYDEDDESDSKFTPKEFKLEDGFVTKESEIGKKEAF